MEEDVFEDTISSLDTPCIKCGHWKAWHSPVKYAATRPTIVPCEQEDENDELCKCYPFIGDNLAYFKWKYDTLLKRNK